MSAITLRIRSAEDAEAIRELQALLRESTQSKAIWTAIRAFPRIREKEKKLARALREESAENTRMKTAALMLFQGIRELAEGQDVGQEAAAGFGLSMDTDAPGGRFES